MPLIIGAFGGRRNTSQSGNNLLYSIGKLQFADAVVYDTRAAKLKALAAGTILKSQLPSSIVPLGVCYAIENNIAKITPLVLSSGATAYRWAVGIVYAITGFDLTNGGSFTFTIVGNHNPGTYTINYPAASTAASIIALIRAQCASTQTELSAVGNGIRLVINDYASSAAFTITQSSPTLIVKQLTPRWQSVDLNTIFTQLGETDKVGIINQMYLKRKKGILTSYGIGNQDRGTQYYSTSGSTATNMSVNNSDILRQSAFNATDNPTLYTKYNGDYAAYLDSESVLVGSTEGVEAAQDYKAYNDALASEVFTDMDGTTQHALPAVYNMRSFGIAVDGFTTGFEQGNWYAPTVHELAMLMKPIKLDKTDAVNATIAALGGTQIDARNHYLWSCQVCDINSAYGYLGNYGTISSYYRYYASHCRPFAAFQIK